MAPIAIGVFLPIGNNGWLVSTTSPQFMPSFELNKRICQSAEKYNLDFALSMIKLRGFGGPSQFWDHNLESFTLMAALAAVTAKIKLIASSAILTLPPALAARMAATIDAVAPGRFGINIVTGWQRAEYTQMSAWPGDAYFGYRYDYAAEYVQVLQDLLRTGVSNHQGAHFSMDDCRLSPRPQQQPIPIVAAGQSARGLAFAARFADYNFAMGAGVNTPTAFAPAAARLVEAALAEGRPHVGSYVLFMVIAAETDEEAEDKWKLYNDGADREALAWMMDQGGRDTKADASATVSRLAEGAVNMSMGTLVGSYAKVAGMLDEVASVEGTSGIMLAFDDFVEGMDAFGQKIQPLMKSREGKA